MAVKTPRRTRSTTATVTPTITDETSVIPTTAARGGKAADTSKLYTIHSLEDVQIDTRVVRVAALDEAGARTLTEQIQRTSVRLWLLVTEAHDRKAHLALGYDTWADYVKAELSMSESRSYQFLDTGHVMKALASAGVDIEKASPPPTRVVARIKDRLTDVRRVATKAMASDDGEDSVDKAIRALAREPMKREVGAPRGSSAPAAKVAASEPVVSATQAADKLAQCPACKGSGRVERGLVDVITDLMKKVRPPG